MIRNEELWRDTDGNVIQVCGRMPCMSSGRASNGHHKISCYNVQAHGGSMLYHEGVFYWYGEHKGGPTLPPKT